MLRVKYTPSSPDSTLEEIQEVILSKDKYLELGHYLYMSRCDWNDGYDSASYGLDLFTVGTTIDENIVSELNEIINCGREDYYVDGRVFRDCTYSYDKLFSMVVDKTLVEDLNKVYSYKNA